MAVVCINQSRVCMSNREYFENSSLWKPEDWCLPKCPRISSFVSDTSLDMQKPADLSRDLPNHKTLSSKSLASVKELGLLANTMPVPKEPVLSIRELGLLANTMPVPKEPVLSIRSSVGQTPRSARHFSSPSASRVDLPPNGGSSLEVQRESCPLFHACLFRKSKTAIDFPLTDKRHELLDERCARMVFKVTPQELNYVDPVNNRNFLQWICNVGFVKTLEAMGQRADDVKWSGVVSLDCGLKTCLICSVSNDTTDQCSVLISCMEELRAQITNHPTPDRTWRNTTKRILRSVKSIHKTQARSKALALSNLQLVFPLPLACIVVDYFQFT